MSIAEIRKLSIKEKLQIMEALWEDLRSQTENEPIPDWHKEILDDRQRAIDSGKEEILDWDKVKDSLGKRRT